MKKYTKAVQEVVVIPSSAGKIHTDCSGWDCKQVVPCSNYSYCIEIYDCTDEYDSTMQCSKYYADKGCGDFNACFAGACYYYCG